MVGEKIVTVDETPTCAVNEIEQLTTRLVTRAENIKHTVVVLVDNTEYDLVWPAMLNVAVAEPDEPVTRKTAISVTCLSRLLLVLSV